MVNKSDFPAYKIIETSKLSPYDKNAKTHPKEQVSKIVKSIKEYGFINPVIINNDGRIVAGHGRFLAALELGINFLPCIDVGHLTDAQARAYALADNKIILDSDWDNDLLKFEISELQSLGFDLSLTGFDSEEIQSILGDEKKEKYTLEVSTPIYEPSERPPEIKDLIDTSKFEYFTKKINTLSLEEDAKQFLYNAAHRFNVFSYKKIADFYAHSELELQQIMEELGLVIIDFEKAIELGFVDLTKDMQEQVKKIKGNGDI